VVETQPGLLFSGAQFGGKTNAQMDIYSGRICGSTFGRIANNGCYRANITRNDSRQSRNAKFYAG
jgi:hypothetical protein